MQKFVRGFFWFAFAAFLAASIPHVAYFFRSFEPLNDGSDLWWWCVSYFIAASIDVTIFLLSVTVAQLHRDHKSGGLIFSVWMFILALASLSWFINFKYAEHFLNADMLSATPLTLPLTSVRIADINPLIASAFQALAIAYTWISDKISANEQPKTATQIATEANELKAMNEALKSLKEAKRSATKDSLDGIAELGSYAFSKLPKIRISRKKDETTERNTDELEALNTDSIIDPAEDQLSNQLEEDCDEITTFEEDQQITPDSFNPRSTVSIEKAAELLNIQSITVTSLIRTGRLKTAARNKKRVTMASIKAYHSRRLKRVQLVNPDQANKEEALA